MSFLALPAPLQIAAALFLAACALLYVTVRFHAAAVDHLDDAAAALAATQPPPALDPWEMQRDLMERSGQRLPRSPTLHNGVLLYAALNLEELGEMFQNLGNAIPHYCDVTQPCTTALALEHNRIGRLLRRWSVEIRSVLKEHDVGSFALSLQDARALFDDTTDLQVTNCGFAEACGFPGPAGYAEVQDSNLSKGNPETGKIDKTADGKWIKGANYYEPDLAGVLRQHCPLWAIAQGSTAGDGGVRTTAYASGGAGGGSGSGSATTISSGSNGKLSGRTWAPDYVDPEFGGHQPPPPAPPQPRGDE